MLRLRDYQSLAVDSVYREWESVASTLVVAPTGTGKTVIMCGIARRCFPRRVMILAHREELIFQAQDKIQRYAGLRAEVEMADLRANEDHALFGRAPVVVSSIQTQCAGGDGLGRMGKFDPCQFAVLVIDEAHHATAATYRRVIDYYRSNPRLKVVGVTATPDRADEQALGQVFESVALDYEILDAIHDGWLVPIQQRLVEVAGLDYSEVRTTAGDLNGADLARVLEAEKILHGLASPTVELAGSRRTLVFCASVQQAERMAEILRRHGKTADWVCGDTPKPQRRKLLDEFSGGRIQFMCNCGVLTEGFDDAGIELVVVGRPTKSRCLYAQMIGRGTRPLPGIVDPLETADDRKAAIAASAKPSLEVLDFAGNAGRHKLVCTADILSGNVSDEALEQAKAKARGAGKPVDMEALLEETMREIEERKRAEEARRLRLRVKAQWSAKSVDPFDVLELHPRSERGWERGRQLSEKQKALLAKQGIDADSRPYHEAKHLLDELFRRWDGNLCSFKQAQWLKKYGLPTDVTRDVAKATLDGIWKERRQPADALALAMASAPTPIPEPAEEMI